MRPQRPSDATDYTVLHVVQPGEGGVARVVLDQVAAQTALGLTVVLACPAGTRLAEEAARLDCALVPWPAVRSPARRLVREGRSLARIVASVRPDVVHAHSAKAGLVARAVLRGRVPTVFQPHAWSFEAADSRVCALALRWERWAARWTHRVVCVSEAERRRGERAGIRAPWSVVLNGVDLDRFAVDTDVRGARRELPALAALPDDALTVVCVGRLCLQKGQDTLLDAWPRVVERFPGAHLVLVGDGPDEAALRRAAPASVTFAGAVDDTAPWYRAADLVVLPSRWEGLAVAPLEAMATGRALVVTDVDGARESLPPEQHALSLVPPDDPLALAKAVTRLLERADLRSAQGESGRRHVVGQFDVRRSGAAVAEVYREVTCGPHTGRELVSP
ncbi:glycosyltransferase [Streptomyces sp. NPDC050504]|uniref:glycosyltransferase n=1 Tax=Streptomyces sp. NPDC050504 TaxID=3365618 RepID=UPI0037AF42E9